MYVQYHHGHTYTVNVVNISSEIFSFRDIINYIEGRFYLNVSNIIVNRTNLPSRGTTSEVGGMISASSKKNTVSDSRIEMDKLTCKLFERILIIPVCLIRP